MSENDTCQKKNVENGFAAEKFVASYLEKLGWKLLETHFRRRGFEVDLLMLDAEGVLVGLEIKWRRDLRFVPRNLFGQWFNHQKITRVAKGLDAYLQLNYKSRLNTRVDGVVVTGSQHNFHIMKHLRISEA